MKTSGLFDDECQILQKESYGDFIIRYSGFGKDFYLNVKNKFPEIFDNLKFYKAIKSTGKCSGNTFPNYLDSYAHFVYKKIELRIYLDPESEVIGIHNFELSFETGYWSEQPIMELNSFIEEKVISLLTD